MSDSLPTKAASKPAQLGLFGFAVKKPAEKPRPKAKRRPPLRACGARHWPKVCPACLEQDPPEYVRSSSQLSELPGETFEDIFRGAA